MKNLFNHVGRRAHQNEDCAVSRDGKRYWLTPPDLLEKLNSEFKFDFDACPFPRPENYDSTAPEIEWGNSTYVNPPFKGPTKWIKKAVAEVKKGKRVVFVFPMREWLGYLLDAALNLEIRKLGRIRWLDVDDKTPSPGNPWMIYAFVISPNKGIKE